MLLIRKISLSLLFTLFVCNVSTAQEIEVAHIGKSITLKFSAYTVEQNKSVAKEFSKSDGFRITYTCIPAGIIIIESEKEITASEKTAITTKIKNIKEKLIYITLEGFSQEQAEQACSDLRKN